VGPSMSSERPQDLLLWCKHLMMSFLQLFLIFTILFFSPSLLTYLYFNCFSLSRFPGQHPPNPSSSTSLWVFPSPSSLRYGPPPNNHVHWEFSQDQGLPLPLVLLLGYSLLPLRLEPRVSPCIVFG